MLRRLFIRIAIATGAAMVALGAQPQPRPRWPPKTIITVWLDARAAPPDVDGFVDRALHTWTRAADGRFVLQRTSSRDSAAIHVRFAQADGIYGEAAPGIDGRTGFIGSAEVLIAADVGGDALQQRIVIYLTALHELGHALGLPHTNAFDDIMYSFRRPDDGPRYFGA